MLGALLAFGALNAFAGGWFGLTGARGVPLEWLGGSPFRHYFIPSLILFVIVGGTLACAALTVLARWRYARPSALAAGIVLLVWIGTQLTIIGYVSWMQPATVIGGVFILLLSRRLAAELPLDQRGESLRGISASR